VSPDLAARGSATDCHHAFGSAQVGYEAAYGLATPLSYVRGRLRDEGIECAQRERTERRSADPVREADVLIDKERTSEHAEACLAEERHPAREYVEVSDIVEPPHRTVQRDEFAEVALVEDDGESTRGLAKVGLAN
jgi:hypothetical protein